MFLASVTSRRQHCTVVVIYSANNTVNITLYMSIYDHNQTNMRAYTQQYPLLLLLLLISRYQSNVICFFTKSRSRQDI